MSGAGPVDGTAPTWRVTGWRRWTYAVVLIVFLAQAVLRLIDLLTGPPPHTGDGIFFTLATLAVLCYGAMSVALRRTRVTLLPEGIEIRSYRTRLIPYADVERAHRSHWSRNTVTLDLLDASKIALPAPVAGLKDPAPELDEAVDLINARIAAVRSGTGDAGPR